MVKKILTGVKKNLTPTIALFLYLSKCLIISTGYPDAIIMMVLGSLYIGKKYLDKLQLKKHNDDLLKDVENVKNAITAIKMEKLSPPKVQDVKNTQTTKRIF